jgi:hypothetical protein
MRRCGWIEEGAGCEGGGIYVDDTYACALQGGAHRGGEEGQRRSIRLARRTPAAVSRAGHPHAGRRGAAGSSARP